MHFICCLKHYIQTEQSRKRLVLNSSVSLTIVVILSGWCRLQSYTHWLFTSNKRHILLIGCAVYPWAAFSRQVSTASGIRMTECPFFVHIDWFECARLKMSVQYIKKRKKSTTPASETNFAFYVPPPPPPPPNVQSSACGTGLPLFLEECRAARFIISSRVKRACITQASKGQRNFLLAINVSFAGAVWTSSCMLGMETNGETDHLQHDLFVDISYKFTLA